VSCITRANSLVMTSCMMGTNWSRVCSAERDGTGDPSPDEHTTHSDGTCPWHILAPCLWAHTLSKVRHWISSGQNPSIFNAAKLHGALVSSTKDCGPASTRKNYMITSCTATPEQIWECSQSWTKEALTNYILWLAIQRQLKSIHAPLCLTCSAQRTR